MTDAPIQAASSSKLRRAICAGAVIAAFFALTGCSTNLTGFEFPRFGLTSDPKKPDTELSDPRASSSQSLSATDGL